MDWEREERGHWRGDVDRRACDEGKEVEMRKGRE